MTVRVYKSTFPGMSTIANTAGSLISVLDAVLVNGTSGVSVTSITRSGSTATVSQTAHGLCTSAWVTISGAGQSEYNGDHQITVIDANSYSYTVSGTPATPATGTLTMGMTAAGWTKPHSGTNLAAYLQGTHATNPNQFYLYVGDTTTTYASIRGYETMSGINDTSGAACPTASQAANFYSIKGSSSGRSWIAIATNRTIHLFTDYAGTLGTLGGLFFGDFENFDVNDNYMIGIIGGTSQTSGYKYDVVDAAYTAHASHYFFRPYSQSGTSEPCRKNINSLGGISVLGYQTTPVAYPSAVTGGLVTGRVLMSDTSTLNIRGFFPGVYVPFHNAPLTNGDTFSGSGDLLNKRFIACKCGSGQVMVEITNGW